MCHFSKDKETAPELGRNSNVVMSIMAKMDVNCMWAIVELNLNA